MTATTKTALATAAATEFVTVYTSVAAAASAETASRVIAQRALDKMSTPCRRLAHALGGLVDRSGVSRMGEIAAMVGETDGRYGAPDVATLAAWIVARS